MTPINKAAINNAGMIFALAVGMIHLGAAAAGQETAGRVPVLLELFTSEGCSSCPPADKLLEAFDRSQPVPGADLIVLSEHVDYWNHGGWSDPYSSAAYTARQRNYAKRFDLDSSYTPQLVVDGQSELVGSNAVEAKSAIAKAAREQKLTVTVTPPEREGDHLKLHVEVPAGARGSKSTATVYLALADNEDRSHVAGGENGGRLLTHVAVVRVLTPLGTLPAGGTFTKDVTAPIKGGLGASGLRVVAFVQDQNSGHILGVAQQRIPKL